MLVVFTVFPGVLPRSHLALFTLDKPAARQHKLVSVPPQQRKGLGKVYSTHNCVGPSREGPELDGNRCHFQSVPLFRSQFTSFPALTPSSLAGMYVSSLTTSSARRKSTHSTTTSSARPSRSPTSARPPLGTRRTTGTTSTAGSSRGRALGATRTSRLRSCTRPYPRTRGGAMQRRRFCRRRSGPRTLDTAWVRSAFPTCTYAEAHTRRSVLADDQRNAQATTSSPSSASRAHSASGPAPTSK